MLNNTETETSLAEQIKRADPFYAQRYHATPLAEVNTTIATRATTVRVNRFMRASSARFCGTE